MQYGNQYWHHKSIRDPLYGFIHLSERETKLIGTPFIHRLSRIKQLAHSYLVYPSAVHTRLEHSLGALHLADRLCTSFHINDERREIIRCAVLLHDCGHGPFSHPFESILSRVNENDRFTHEEITQAIVTYDEEISSILQGKHAFENDIPNIHSDVLDLYKKDSSDSLGRSIVSGSMDVDKMDYLRRDSYHTGTTYGIFDLERILATLQSVHDEATGFEYPAILEKGVPALESFRLARYLLHSQVYHHHTRIIADRMFLRSLELAIFEEDLISKDLLRFYHNKEQFIKSYLYLDDNSIYEVILSHHGNKPKSKAVEIIQDLKNRRLFKRAYEKDLKEMAVPQAMSLWKADKHTFTTIENSIAQKAKVDPEMVIAYGESEDDALKSYRTFATVTQAGDIPILYIDSNGVARPYEDRSPINVKTDMTKKFYIFTKEEYRKGVSIASNDELH